MAQNRRILVVEDNDGIRELLRDLFDEEGYEILVVDGGEQMRAALAAGRFDVAVIDVTLPGAENGFALAEVARSAGCGVILVTGDGRHFDDIERSGHRYLLKPFRIDRLLALVDEVFKQSDCKIARRHG